MKKYKLKRLNCVQETDSEERMNELREKGYVLCSINGKAVEKPGAEETAGQEDKRGSGTAGKPARASKEVKSGEKEG